MTKLAKARDLDGPGSALPTPTGRPESIDLLRGGAAMAVVLLQKSSAVPRSRSSAWTGRLFGCKVVLLRCGKAFL